MKQILVFGIFGFYLRDMILEKTELVLLFHKALIFSIIFDDQQLVSNAFFKSINLRLLG